jgi:lathosterol oxidase
MKARRNSVKNSSAVENNNFKIDEQGRVDSSILFKQQIASEKTPSPSLKHGTFSLYWLTDFFFTHGLVLIGLAYATQKLMWLQCFAELFVIMTSFIMTGSVFVVIMCGLYGTKQQTNPPQTPEIWQEALDSIKAMYTFAALAAWPLYMYKDGQPMGLTFSLAEAQPWAPESVALYCLQLVGATLIVDLYSYIKHKSMHSQYLFQFHAMHHTYRDPTAFASFAVHPVESFLTFVPVLGMCFPQHKVWAHAYGIWTFGWALINLYLHCGHTIPIVEMFLQPLLLNSSGFHNSHHQKMWTNYGELLYVWDIILDTGFHPGTFFTWNARKSLKVEFSKGL